MVNLLSEASVTSSRCPSGKHRLQLAEMEGGLEGRERTQRLPTYHTLERQGAHRSTPSSHSTADGEVGSGILTAINDRGWEPIASHNCVLLQDKRTSPFRRFNFVWHFLRSEHSVLDFHCPLENVLPQREKMAKILRDQRNGGQFAHKQTEKRSRLSDNAELTTGEQKNTSAMMKAAFSIDQTKFVLKRESERHGNSKHCD